MSMLNGMPESSRTAVWPNRATITDVAEALGVTKGTVSRALNGYPDISDSTREKVEKKAKELAYRPLSHAQAIKTGLSKSVGLVIQINEPDSHRPFLAGFLGGVSTAASAEGWTLTVATATSNRDTLDTISRLVDQRKADGFILPRIQVGDPRVALLREANVPFVMFGRDSDDSGCAWYDILGEGAMEAAVGRLAEFGHRKIAFVNGGAEYTYSRYRLQGYFAGMEKSGLVADHAYIRGGAVTVEQGAEAAESLLNLPDPPTAFVFAVDMAALGLYQVAEKHGLQIGSDLSVIAYDGIPEGAFARPPLTTFSVDMAQAGERLASILISRIRGVPPDELRESENARLLARSSDGPKATSSRQLAARISGSVQQQHHHQ